MISLFMLNESLKSLVKREGVRELKYEKLVCYFRLRLVTG